MILSELNIYPIKSCRGISLAEAVVEERGLQFDRRWMLVDENNRFLTQREYPVMAMIATRIEDGQLRIESGGQSLSINARTPTVGEERVAVWSSRVRADVYSDELNEFFSQALRTRVRLVTMSNAKRPVNYWYRVHKGDNVSLADAFPFLVIGQGSLDELNRRLTEGGAAAVPMNRFRPNFVVKGSEPFAEDTWKRVRIGGTVFHVVKACARCPIPTIDQETGERHSSEPTRTLAEFRMVRRRGKNKILFGQNLIADVAGGTVHLGDEVEVLEHR